MNRLNRSAQQRALASRAEEYVADILISQSWRIVARNYRWIGTEIDILAVKESSLVAVEVKFRTRFTHDMTSVSGLMPRLKVQSLKKGLHAAIRYFGINAAKTRIDLAIVTHQADVSETKMPSGKSPKGIKNYPFKVTWYPAIDA